VVRRATELTPSAQGELEITDINVKYLNAGKLNVERMGRGFLARHWHQSITSRSKRIRGHARTPTRA
jgi:dTDP-glucose pyrophosphorylase